VEERALVMELVPGETLKGPLPLATALNYAKQIAEALEAAHEKGIVHRDLKPGNVIVTPDGVAKVLDFGLAAVTQPSETPGADPSKSPTLTMRATEAGLIMGTAAYMSPEQAAGRPMDKRADTWSFGVVLWEMLTGRRLFDGESISHTLADVLRGPIDFDKLPKETPRAIRELLRRCLDRDVKTRLRDIGEARVAIEGIWLIRGVKPDRLKPVPQSCRGQWLESLDARAYRRLALQRDAAGAPAAADSPERGDRVRHPLARAGLGNMLAISPDGARLALTLRGADGKVHLYTRLLN